MNAHSPHSCAEAPPSARRRSGRDGWLRRNARDAWAGSRAAATVMTLTVLLMMPPCHSGALSVEDGPVGKPVGFGATEANDFAISAIPSVAISGVESVFSLHGLNFVPGGIECELCNLDDGDSQCRFGVASPARIDGLSSRGASRCVAGPRSTMLQGFAAALLSYDGGGHWVGVPGVAGAGEHSVVSFAPTPTTRQSPLLLAAPVGMPVTLSGAHYLPDPSFGCAFGGSAGTASMGSFVSSAAFKCEVPAHHDQSGADAWWGAAVLPVAQAGAAEASAASTLAATHNIVGSAVAELSRPTPWVGALAASPSQIDAAGGALLAVPVVDLDIPDDFDRAWWTGNLTKSRTPGGGGSHGSSPPAGSTGDASSSATFPSAAAKMSARAGSSDPRSAAARTLGCLVGTVRVAATRFHPGTHNGVECLAPAGRAGAGRLVPVRVGAPRAEMAAAEEGALHAAVHLASEGSRAWTAETFEPSVVFIGAGRSRALRLGAPPPPPAALLRRTAGFDVVNTPPVPMVCVAGIGGRPAEARRVPGRPNEVECWPPAPGGGDAARGAGFVPVALVWAEGSIGGDASSAWGARGTALGRAGAEIAIDARRETEVLAALPRAVAAGGAANRPTHLLGVDLPAETSGWMSPACVYGGGGGTTSSSSYASRAMAVSSALVVCGPAEETFDLDAVASEGGGGAALGVEAGWAGADRAATSRSGLRLRVEATSAAAIEAAAAIDVVPASAPTSGGVAVVFPVAAGAGIEETDDGDDGDGSEHSLALSSDGVTCHFGTISGVAARRASRSTAFSTALAVECAAPAHSRGEVPVRVSLPSGASHFCVEDDRGTSGGGFRGGGRYGGTNTCGQTFRYSAALPWRTWARGVSWTAPGEGVEATADRRGRAASLASVAAPAASLAGGNLPITMTIDMKAAAAAAAEGGGGPGHGAGVPAEGLAPLWCHVATPGSSPRVHGAAFPATPVSGAMVKCEPPILLDAPPGPASAWLAPVGSREEGGSTGFFVSAAGPVGFRWERAGIEMAANPTPSSISAGGGTAVRVAASGLEAAVSSAADGGGAGYYPLGCVFGAVSLAGRSAPRGSAAGGSAVECVSPAAAPGARIAIALEAGLSRWRTTQSGCHTRGWSRGTESSFCPAVAVMPDAVVDAAMPSAAIAEGGATVALTLRGLSVGAFGPTRLPLVAPPCLLDRRSTDSSRFAHRDASLGVVACLLGAAPEGFAAVSLDPSDAASASMGAAGDATATAASILLVSAPRVRGAHPKVMPREGGAVAWIEGRNLPRHDDDRFAPGGVACAFNVPGGATVGEHASGEHGSREPGVRSSGADTSLGFIVAASSAVAACVTPEARGGGQRGGGVELSAALFSAAPGALSFTGGSSGAGSALVHWNRLALPRVASVTPGTSREGGGAFVDVAVAGVGELVHGAASGEEDRGGASVCLFGTIGPIAGRVIRERTTTGEAGAAVQCVTPGAKAGARGVALAAGFAAALRGPFTVVVRRGSDLERSNDGERGASLGRSNPPMTLFHAPAAVVDAAIPSLVPAETGAAAVTLVGYGLRANPPGADASEARGAACVLDGAALPTAASSTRAGDATCAVPGGASLGLGSFGWLGGSAWATLTLSTAAETGGASNPGGVISTRRTPTARAAFPAHLPIGGGGVATVLGARLVANQGVMCVFVLGGEDGGTERSNGEGSPNVWAGAATAVEVVSAAVGRCESPPVRASGGGHASVVSLGWSTTVGLLGPPDASASSNALQVLASRPASVAAVTPNVVPAGGGATLTVSLQGADVYAGVGSPRHPSSGGASGGTPSPVGPSAVPLQCRIGAVGPVASRSGHAAEGTVECVAPARAPSRTPARVEVGPGRGGWSVWGDEGGGRDRPDARLLVLGVGGRHAAAWPAPPGLAVVQSSSSSDGGGSWRSSAMTSVTMHSVTPVPVFGWGLACAVPGGGEREGELVREHGNDGEGGDVDVRCALPARWLPPGAAFVVIEVHARAAPARGGGGTPSGGRAGHAGWAITDPGAILEVFAAPAVISAFPSLGAAGGGGVVWARSADLVVEGGTIRGGFACDFGGVPGSFAGAVSSALGRCEAPAVASVSVVRYARGDLGALHTPAGFDAAAPPSPAPSSRAERSSLANGDEASIERDRSRWSSGSALVAALYTPAHQPRVARVGPSAVPSEGGGTIGALGHGLTSAAARASSEATAACHFGTVGPVTGAAVAGGGGGAVECRSPASAPGAIALRFALGGGAVTGLWATFGGSFLGTADGGASAVVVPLRVLSLAGDLAGVMPSVVAADGSGPRVHAVGFGLQPTRGGAVGGSFGSFGGADAADASLADGSLPAPMPRPGDDGAGSSGGSQSIPEVACAVGQTAPAPALSVTEGGGAVLCPPPRTAGSGFWVVAVGAHIVGAGLGAARLHVETVPTPTVRTVAPGTSPGAGGGLVWAVGSHLASGHWLDGRGEACMLVAGVGSHGDHAGAMGAARAVSSALAACEVPAWWGSIQQGHAGVTVEGGDEEKEAKLSGTKPATVGVFVGPRGFHSDFGSLGGVEGANPRSRLEYLAEAQITGRALPRRGPTTGGTPVRLSGAGLGWAASVGSAGCRFGSVAVSLRVATDLAGGVECITPAKKFGTVELAVASDLRSVSQPLTYTEKGTPATYLFAVF